MAYDENIYARIVSGELSEEEIGILKESGEWEEIQSILLATENIVLPSHDKEKGFEDLKSRNKSKAKSKARKLNPYIFGIAASILLLVGSIFLFGDNQVSVGSGMAQNLKTTLPDGSSIVLNDGSSINYSRSDWKDRRELSLKGEAFFQVKSGESFVVKTENGQVEVLGTQFNVRSWGENLYVECYEGSVKVMQGGSEQILIENQSLNIVGGNENELNTMSHSEPLWQSGTLRFQKEMLSEVFKEIERQYDVTIEFNQKDRSFSGFFEEGNLTNALKQVCDPMNLEINIIDDKKIIISN